ncbi:hypothetical protein PPL_11654 [Heterostelium album PN500]|uniref:EGF-like domain-containing protein n=1 Tax=Heterostelium pallidum (strain ATCC 26659 / Pp 5 / PN500) TaxID=670386 RepID=D3BVC8_HETP5|nr:hypothetical protein PPL_11654 [Heterostelium album PN500]EFA74685.1 hypothetical protein PPL_11654 [Heterostelium album PN500]|eukprot:XP_020426819.1 hypothetical protein PPL_11654 [Heterostelium album PN500]
MYPEVYLQVSFGGTKLSEYSTTTTSLLITVPPGSQSSQLLVQTLTSQTIYNNIIYLIPYLISVNQSLISTSQSSLQITGDFFQSNPGPTKQKIYFGDIEILADVLSMNEISFTTPSGIVSRKDIRAYSYQREVFSNALSFSYNRPTVISFTQNQTETNVITIEGSDFGISSSLLSVTNNNNINFNFTFLSVNNTQLIAILPNTIITNIYNIFVDTQQTVDPLYLNLQPTILPISAIAPVTGGPILVIGYFLRYNTIYAGNATIKCNSIDENNYPARMICTVPMGAGRFQVHSESALVSTNNKTSNYVNTNYVYPSIVNVNPKVYFENNETIFTIFGNNFIDIDFVWKINNEVCNVTQVNTRNATCTLTPKINANTTVNPISIFVSVSGLADYSNYTLSYYTKPCLNDCSSHGQCNYTVAVCQCDQGYQGSDCSEQTPTTTSGTTTTVTTTTTGTTTTGATTTGATTTDINSSNQLSFNFILTALLLIIVITTTLNK